MQKLQSNFSASCVEMIFDFDTTCVEVSFSTSVQLGQKCGCDFHPSWSEVDFENSAQVGQNYFLPVDISLENVLTGREKFSSTVEICLLNFRI